MTVEGIEQYMSVELGERLRTVCSSDLMRKFSQPFEQVQAVMRKFVESSNCIDNVYVAVSETDGSGATRIRITRLSELGDNHYSNEGNWWYYLVKPGRESVASAWSREIETMKKMAADAAPKLWAGASVYAGIVSDREVQERQVQVRVEIPAATSNPAGKSATVASTQNSASNKNKLGFAKQSGPIVAAKQAPQPTVPVSQPTKASVKTTTAAVQYQVPLDSLGGECPGTPEREREETETLDMSVEQVMGEEMHVDETIASPQSKRQKIEEPVDEPESSPPSSPQFREVVIKKKVVVSEYEMNENGEMIVRDVEKMVEEIVREQVKVPEKKKQPGFGGSSSANNKKKPASSAPSGQGTLTGFFSSAKSKS